MLAGDQKQVISLEWPKGFSGGLVSYIDYKYYNSLFPVSQYHWLVHLTGTPTINYK